MILESTELLATARRSIHNQYGEEIAAKASDQFCLAFGLERRQTAVALEGAGDEAVPAPAILEFERPPDPIAEGQRVGEATRAMPKWRWLNEVLREVAPREPDLRLDASALLRQVRVRSLRDEFLRTAGSLIGEVERNAYRLGRMRPEAVPLQGSGSMTEVCWLNRTIRAWVDPRALAEVAADTRLSRLDIPRRLDAEIRQTTRLVGAPQFREARSRSGKDVIIAVIDSEIAAQHPAFQDRVILKRNFSLEPWGNPGAHGTSVAGIAAASGEGFLGVAPEATVYNYKVLATNRFLNADDFGGALAIQSALEDGADIANCSWGAGPAGDGTSREAVACDRAWSLGMTIVKSAGNRGASGTGTLTTPADAEGVIVVGATDRQGATVADYSSQGPTGHQPGRPRPHLVAPGGVPGQGIESCLVQGGFGDCGHGTSFAASHVSGLLALILEEDPSLTPDQQRDALLRACALLASGDENLQGGGLVSLERLL